MDKTVPNITPTCETARDRAEYSMLSYMAGVLRHKQFFDGLANAAKLITGPLVSLGGSSLIASSITGANPLLLTAAIVLLAGAAISLTTAVAASYMSSHISRNHSVTEATLQAKLSAKSLVEELKANNMCLNVEPPARANSKSWVELTQAESQTPNQISH